MSNTWNGTTETSAITIRHADADDRPAIEALAQRDSASVPGGPVVIAENDGEIRVAVAVESGATIADPFHRTADLVALVHARAEQIKSARNKRLRVAARRSDQAVAWRSTGRREAAASSSLRTGVV